VRTHRLSRALVSLLVFSISLNISVQAAHAALSTSSVTTSPISSTGGGGSATGTCSSPRVLNALNSYTYNYNGTTISYLYGLCASLSSNGLTLASDNVQNFGPYGTGWAAGTYAQVNCGTSGSNRVIVGARLYKTPSGYAAGIQPLCGTLPNGSSRSYLGGMLGITTSTSEEIACNTGDIAIGVNVRYGGILDSFGIQCGTLSDVGQSITLTTIGTTSKTYPYSQALTMATSGSSGTGSISYAIASGGTATGCSLSNSTSSATISATTSGTCLVAATIAADSLYAAATSSSSTFTFNKASQSALTVSSTSGTYGTALSLTTTGGSGTGAVTYAYAAGTTTCSLSGSTLTAIGYGTCLVTATKATDVNYLSITSSQATVTFAQLTATASISIASGSPVYRETKLVSASTSVAGKVTFKVNGKFISGCRGLASTSANSYTATCSYKPNIHGYITITATLAPTDSLVNGTIATSERVWVSKRSSAR